MNRIPRRTCPSEDTGHVNCLSRGRARGRDGCHTGRQKRSAGMSASPQAECASDSSQPGAQTQGACVLIPELPSTGGEAGRVCTGGTGVGRLPLGLRLESPQAFPWSPLSIQSKKPASRRGRGETARAPRAQAKAPVSGAEAECLQASGGGGESPPGTRSQAETPCFSGKMRTQPLWPQGRGKKALLSRVSCCWGRKGPGR